MVAVAEPPILPHPAMMCTFNAPAINARIVRQQLYVDTLITTVRIEAYPVMDKFSLEEWAHPTP